MGSSVEQTVKPVRFLFAEIAWGHTQAGVAVSEHILKGFEKFERVVEYARWEIVTGLWEMSV